MANSVDFVVSRTDLRRTAFVPGLQGPDTPLAPGQVLVRVERFAFTANNVTYGAVGDMIGYWNFFPAADGWGRIPVWGFGEVVASRHEAVARGERLYGYFPMSTYVALLVDAVSPNGFVDVSPHRLTLPAIYNRYTRVAQDPGYDPAHEGEIALFLPLFATAFLLDDFLADKDFFGAGAVVLSSASSKTALGLAFLLTEGKRGRRVVGLTSPANEAFVVGTGYYDTVATYDTVRTLPRETPSVYVDFAGDGRLLGAVHEHFGDNLGYSSRVGVTHWEEMAPPDGLKGPVPILFFAPDQARQRSEEWGGGVLERRVADAMRRFLGSAARWLQVIHGRGQAAVESVYHAMVEGRMRPAEGHVLAL